MKDYKIYVDMDGVLVDMVRGLHDYMKVSYDSSKYHYPKNEYKIFPYFIKYVQTVHHKEFNKQMLYDMCDSHHFWRDLKKEPTADALLSMLDNLVDMKNVFICSYPMAGPDTWSGKVAWVEKNYPQLSRQMILSTAPKSVLAGNNTLLIDDNNENHIEFGKAGGNSFLVPQPWNMDHELFGTDWITRLKNYITDLNNCYK